MRWRGWLMLAAAAAGLGLGGCTTFFGGESRHVVGDSQLNWLEISYIPGGGRPAMTLSLLGSGHIRFKRGTSPRMTNDFSQDVNSAAWNDVKTDAINVAPDEMRNILQSFCDRGLFGKPSPDFVAAAERGGPFARIRGSLDGENVVRYAVEPELIDLVRTLARMCEEPSRADGGK